MHEEAVAIVRRNPGVLFVHVCSQLIAKFSDNDTKVSVTETEDRINECINAQQLRLVTNERGIRFLFPCS